MSNLRPGVLEEFTRIEGRYYNFIAIKRGNEVLVASEESPRDGYGKSCTYEQFLEGELAKLAVEFVGEEMYRAALASVEKRVKRRKRRKAK